MPGLSAGSRAGAVARVRWAKGTVMEKRVVGDQEPGEQITWLLGGVARTPDPSPRRMG